MSIPTYTAIREVEVPNLLLCLLLLTSDLDSWGPKNQDQIYILAEMKCPFKVGSTTCLKDPNSNAFFRYFIEKKST